MKVTQLIAITALCSTVALGCGKDSNNGATNNNPTPNNTATNNASNNDTNGETNASTNNETTPTNNGQSTGQSNNDLPRDPFITEFSYLQRDEGFGGNDEGLVVSVLGRNIANLDGNQSAVDQDDLDTFVAQYLGDETLAKMETGWDCSAEPGDPDAGADPDAGGDAGSTILPPTWRFKARIQTPEGSDRREQEVTTCYENGRADVTDLIDAMNTLGSEYAITP